MTPRILLPVLFLSVLVLVFGSLLALAGPASIWFGLAAELQGLQRDLHRQLARAMRAVAGEGAAATQGLIVLSFLYGVLHAAGPGHGKVVISTFLLTQESRLTRGLALSWAASLCQGLVAVLMVEVTVGLLGLSLRRSQHTAASLEMASYGLVALVGAVLLAGRMRRLCAHFAQRRARRQLGFAPALSGGDRRCCGHAPVLLPGNLDTPVSLRSLGGLVASIGLRPCTGAVLVLLVAHALDLRWAGIGAVFAMAFGTALTVSLLAALAVQASKVSLRLATTLPGPHSRIALAADTVAAAGGGIIVVFGLLMLQAAMAMPAHPFI